MFCICLTYRRKHIFFPCMKGTAFLCYLTSKSPRSECDSVSKVIFDPHIFRKLPQCFYLCTYLFLYLLSQVNNLNLSVICPPASPGDAMTIPITTRMLFDDSSRLALVHFFFSSSSCHFLSYPADHITASHDNSQQRSHTSRGCLTETQDHSLLCSMAFALPGPPEDRCQHSY